MVVRELEKSSPIYRFRCVTSTRNRSSRDTWRFTPSWKPASSWKRLPRYSATPMKKNSLNNWKTGIKNGLTSFLKERTVNPITKRWCYTHKRVRAAYRSLKINLPYLFTYQNYPKLDIPNTTNSLDGSFSQLKMKLGVHRGMREPLKRKMIEEILGN